MNFKKKIHTLKAGLTSFSAFMVGEDATSEFLREPFSSLASDSDFGGGAFFLFLKLSFCVSIAIVIAFIKKSLSCRKAENEKQVKINTFLLSYIINKIFHKRSEKYGAHRS